ncbi:MAG: glucose 1-dehydrogenase [Gammaproteobacteria bacterium]|nr:glucose 1-dehydrogenase [Gammaproteobacteria bacterium]
MTGMLDGKVALITGGGGGIGRATALTFAREGAQVVVADIDAEAVNETARLLRDTGAQATAVVADMASADDIESMVAATIAAYGRLDCAFNNAGLTGSQVGAGGKLTAQWSEESFDRIVQVNLKGVWLCMKAEIDRMLAQGAGSIVNTASLAGLSGFRTTAGYAASKHGIVGLTKTAAIEYAPTIRVNCVCPGFIDTDMLRDTMLRRGPDILARIPFGELGHAADIAEMVCWLSSDRARYVSGATHTVDGAYMAG